jgi:hypothetical protein
VEGKQKYNRGGLIPMRKIKFYYSPGYEDTEETEIVEYEAGITDEEIENDFLNWVWEKIDASWSDVGDENK